MCRNVHGKSGYIEKRTHKSDGGQVEGVGICSLILIN